MLTDYTNGNDIELPKNVTASLKLNGSLYTLNSLWREREKCWREVESRTVLHIDATLPVDLLHSPMTLIIYDKLFYETISPMTTVTSL